MSFDLTINYSKKFPDEENIVHYDFITLNTRINDGLMDASYLVKDAPRFVPDQNDDIYYFDTGIWSMDDFKKVCKRYPDSELFKILNEDFEKNLPKDANYLYFYVTG